MAAGKETQKIKTVCLFGNYISDYPRIRVIKKALESRGIQVVECHTRKKGLAKYRELARQHKEVKNTYDMLLVAMGGQTLVWFAKLLSGKKVVLDAFASLYITNVLDRKLVTKGSLKASYYALLDSWSARLVDLVLLDTHAQKKFFIKKYNTPESKIALLYTSADPEVFYPAKQQEQDDTFRIHWHGYLVPFYGFDILLTAAKKVQNETGIEFHLTTRNTRQAKEYKRYCKDHGITNIIWHDETDAAGIAERVNSADLCLGIFGDNTKARVVIPNKVVEAAACGKAVITARHEVVEEIFDEGINIALVPPRDASALADAILALRSDHARRKTIAEGALRLFDKKLSPQEQAPALTQQLEKLS